MDMEWRKRTMLYEYKNQLLNIKQRTDVMDGGRAGKFKNESKGDAGESVREGRLGNYSKNT